jgi:translation initiation factor 4E
MIINKLKYKWTFWFDRPDLKISDDNWDQFLIKIDSFQTIEKFWSLFNNILLPSYIQPGVNFHLFKSDIEPKWEDIHNLSGGKWMLTVSKQFDLFTNTLWEKTIIAIIGGTFDDISMEHTNGVVLSVRKGIIKIAIWTKNSLNKNVQMKIGIIWKKLIKKNLYGNNLILEYFPHTNILAN